MRIATEKERFIIMRAKYGLFILAGSVILLHCVKNDECVEPDVGNCEAQTQGDAGISEDNADRDSQIKDDAGFLGDAAEVKIPEVTSELVGKLIFFDPNLSNPPGQSCASCHTPDIGFSEPNAEFPVSQGANPNLFGSRNSPSAAYAAFSPNFHLDEDEGIYEGGQFWDGRAANLEEQAKEPFLNPLEMGMEDEAAVIEAVQASNYAELFELVFGADIWDDTMTAYDAVASAIADFEQSDEVNRFTSKYDYYLAGKATLSEQEQRGLAAFEDESRGNCAACHPSTDADDGTPPLFTDFTYDNLGVPRNPNNPFYDLGPELNPDGEDFIDLGLGGVLEDSSLNGLFKVPTLRNIALTAPYMHNGVFSTLEEVVRFYSTRDVGTADGTPWPEPEVAENVNDEELGDLGLTEAEIDDIVVFLFTLTDGYAPANGR